MKLSFTTSADGIESANCLLRIAIENLSQNPQMALVNGIKPIHIYNAMIFRKKMVDAHIRAGKQVRKNKKQKITKVAPKRQINA